MNIYKYAVAVSTVIISLLMTGCSDSDNWKPGPQDDNIGVSAYFEKPASTSYIFEDGGDPDNMKIDLTLSRQNTKEEATVALNVTTDSEGFSYPTSVTFAEGEASTMLTINCSDLPIGKDCNFTISLPEDQTYVYGPGLHEVSCSVIIAKWLLIADKARYLYSDTKYEAIYPATYGKLYQREGSMIFKLTDFFGSGLDVTFECNQPTDTFFYPLQNANIYEDDEDNLWYLYDSANSTWPDAWVPGGVEGYKAIAYLNFYATEDYSPCSMIYDESTLYGYIALTAGVEFDDESFKWGNFQVDFNLDYNPFE